MPKLKPIALTPQQQRFVRAVIDGASPGDAARAAGYAPPYNVVGRALAASPAVASAIVSGSKQLLSTVYGPAALKFLSEVVGDREGKFTARVRLEAAKTIADRAGYVAPRTRSDAHNRDASEMTTEELRALVDEISAELGDRAAVVEPDKPVVDDDVIDLIG